VEQVYRDTAWLPRVNLIASRMERRCGGWVLTLRCLGHEKVVQLEQKIGAPLQLYSGYSDSEQDNPLLFLPAPLAGHAAGRSPAVRIVCN
jgi:phosphatidylglycerophosphatase C